MGDLSNMLSSLRREDLLTLQEMKERIGFEKGFYREGISITEFQEYVLSGDVNDENAVVQLIIDDELRPEYNISINRRLLSRAGQIITFAGLKKMYELDSIKIKCMPRSTTI